MKIQDIFKDYAVMMDCVPLSTSEIGYAYLNNCDTGIWVITFNYKHSSISQEGVTVSQLLQVFDQYSSCFHTMQETYTKQLPDIIETLKKLDANQIIKF